ncbi:hypothetical protein J2T15_003182 [Paenibacillus harenae]|uniref:Uncharacterized protein n=1 Tax=Paenibacillus harenae TaxID=306543 RepID=A0ABT9U653_PAEHA|nr:hypothetical protein [Paenibacillus harenae]
MKKIHDFLMKESHPFELSPQEHAVVNLSLDKESMPPPLPSPRPKRRIMPNKKKCSGRGLAPVTIIFFLTQHKKTKSVNYRFQANLSQRSRRSCKPRNLFISHTKWLNRIKQNCLRDKGAVRTTGSMTIKIRSRTVIKQRFRWTF